MRQRLLIPIALTALLACSEELEGASLVETAPAEANEGETATGFDPDSVVAVGMVAPGIDLRPLAAPDRECQAAAVYFETDSAELSEQARAKLDVVAACLSGTPSEEQVDLRGRTDPRASESYNEALGRQRATAVASYLQMRGADDRSFEIRAIGEQGAVEGMPKLWPAQRNATVRPDPEG